MKNYAGGGRREVAKEREGGEGCPLLTEMPSFQELLLTRTGRGQCAVRSVRNGGCTVLYILTA